MGKPKKVLKAIGRESVREFIVQFLWNYGPTSITAVAVMISGYLENMPVTWIIFAATGVAAFVSTALLRHSEWRAKNRIEDKLIFLGPYVAANKTDDGKNLDVVQIGLNLKNNADFPMSYRVVKISTTADSTIPEHKNFENMGDIIQPGTEALFRDIRINLKIPKSEMEASLDADILYGRPGNEKHELSRKLNLTIRYDAESGRINFPWFNAPGDGQ